MSQNVNVNLTPGGYPKEFHVSQYDVGRQLVAKVVDSTGDYSIPSGATVVLVGTKPSGFGFTLNGTVSGSTVTFSTTATVTAEYGRIPCEIRITNGSTILGTANCMLVVEESPHQEDTVDGDSATVIPELTLLVERIEAAAESIHDLSVSATTLAAGSDATATYDSTNNSIAFGIPRGADGEVSQAELDAAVSDLKSESGISDEVKVALLACFANVAWINDQGQTYYDNLEAALYSNDYPKIIATFSPGANIIDKDDALDDLKQYLTVKYYESKTDTGATIPAANYTLSGVLREGENIIRVTYLDYKAAFIVNAVDFYNISEWSESNGLVVSTGNLVTEYTTTIVSNETSTNRGVAYCGRGKKEIYKYNNGNPVSFDPKKYPIPIPIGTKHVTMTYTGSFLANFNLFKYDENTDTYTYNGQPTYSERVNGTVSFETDVQDENNFILPLFLIGSVGLPTDVSLIFSFD